MYERNLNMTCEKKGTCFLIRKKVFLQTSNAQLNNSKLFSYLFSVPGMFFFFVRNISIKKLLFETRCVFLLLRRSLKRTYYLKRVSFQPQIWYEIIQKFMHSLRVGFERTSFYCIFAFDLKIFSFVENIPNNFSEFFRLKLSRCFYVY